MLNVRQPIEKHKKMVKSDINSLVRLVVQKNKVEGHHIIDHQFSGVASSENIISLCHNCHKAVNNGKMNVFKF